jgi:hypothetical protein
LTRQCGVPTLASSVRSSPLPSSFLVLAPRGKGRRRCHPDGPPSSTSCRSWLAYQSALVSSSGLNASPAAHPSPSGGVSRISLLILPDTAISLAGRVLANRCLCGPVQRYRRGLCRLWLSHGVVQWRPEPSRTGARAPRVLLSQSREGYRHNAAPVPMPHLWPHHHVGPVQGASDEAGQGGCCRTGRHWWGTAPATYAGSKPR